jgi:ABC-2 type transport system permease protein
MPLLKALTRIGSFAAKELVEVVRRPGAFASLVIGPFLIMALFGLGYNGYRRPLNAVFVLPPQAGLSQNPATYQRLAGPAVHVVAVTPDAAAADQELRDKKIDLVVIAPADIRQRLLQGQQSAITVEYNETDPVRAGNAAILASQLSDQVNREIIKDVVLKGEQTPVGQVAGAASIPPDVVAQPTVGKPVNVAPTSPTLVLFFAPAVLALILQHMGVTLTALSLVRERLSGAMELFRISPASPVEILLGKYLGFAILSGVIALVTVSLMVGVLGVPDLGQSGLLALIVALLVFASLGLGLLISVIADSERQAVQLSLLVLLASVFFGGLVLPLTEFHPLLRDAAYALPVTAAISLLQDWMLRGSLLRPWELGVLAGVGLLLFVLTALRLQRVVRHA